MKECPNCGELNGDQNERCYKCNTYLGKKNVTKKICPRCMEVYYDGALESCPKCHEHLRDYDSVNTSSYGGGGYGPDVPIWAYVVAVLLPFVGIIMGLIYLTRGDDDVAKRLILVSIIVSVICGIGYFMITTAVATAI